MTKKDTQAEAGYRYKRLTPKLLFDDFSFDKRSPQPGDKAPEFELQTVDGKTIQSADILSGRPVLLTFGSMSCPMTASSISPLQRLHAEFGDKVDFLMLNVREAHPGENIVQPDTFDEKLEHARAMKKQFDIPFSVAVDDIDGTLHRALDTKPNAAYLIDIDGTIAFRSLWAADENGLREALTKITQGQNLAKRQSLAMFGPLAGGMGYFHEVLKRAGRQAQLDMLKAAPPIFLVGRIASLFQTLSPKSRGMAALATLGSLIFVAIGVLGWLS